MKKSTNILTLILLCLSAVFISLDAASQSERNTGINLATYTFPPNLLRTPTNDTFPYPFGGELNAPGELGVDGSSLGLSLPLASCTERERAIRKIMVDIECFGLSLEELGYECKMDTCVQAPDTCIQGVHDAFIVKQNAIHINRPECEYLVPVIPALDFLPVGRITRGNTGNELMEWIFVCKTCYYQRGDTLFLR